MSTPRAPRTRSSSVAKAAAAGDGNKNVWIIAAVVAVVAFAAIIAIALSQEDGSSGGEETAEVSIEGESLPLYQNDPTGADGMDAPVISGTTFDGEEMTIGESGTPQLIGFFAHWCEFCQREIPVVADWIDGGGLPDDVEFHAVNTSVNRTRPNWPPSDWYEEEGLEIPVLRDDQVGSAHLSYGAGGFPYWVAVDAEGRVVTRQSGEIGAAEIEGLIERARAGAPAGEAPADASEDGAGEDDADTGTTEEGDEGDAE